MDAISFLITFLIKKLLVGKKKNLSFFLFLFWNILWNALKKLLLLVENSVFVFRFSVAFWTEISAETESLNQTETETETHTETEISAETETETENFRSLLIIQNWYLPSFNKRW